MRTGLIGWPLGHSYSPSIHNFAYRMAGIDGYYDLFPIESISAGDTSNLLSDVRSGRIIGLNVTIPHKVSVMDVLDDLTPIAKRIGAVNTIFTFNGRLVGTNTDGAGFKLDLIRNFGSNVFKSGNALVFGAGGSARAVIATLLGEGVRVHVVARDVEKATRNLTGLALPGDLEMVRLDLIDHASFDDCGLFVNTTPLGMYPNIEASPLPDGLTLPTGSLVYDLVYNPEKTKFYEQAAKSECKVATGFGMLVEQALLAFEQWTGVTINRDEFYARYYAATEANS